MSEEPRLEPLSLSDLSSAVSTFSKCELPSDRRERCLVIAFDGQAGAGTYEYMEAMIAAGVKAWRPAAVVLDLKKLKYESGDIMGRVLAFREPRAVLVSDLNRRGLTSLVEQELFSKPSDWLFEKLSDALAACYRQYVAVCDEEVREAKAMMGTWKRRT